MRSTTLVVGLSIILISLSKANAQSFHPCYFRKFLLHATWPNIQKLSQNLNKDKTLAQMKTRVNNWGAKNFGTIKVKSDTLLDNRTYALSRVTDFVTMRFYLKPLMNTFFKNQLTNKIGSADAQKIINAFWRIDHNEMAIEPRNALWMVADGANTFVTEKYKDNVKQTIQDIEDKALQQTDKWKTTTVFYFNLNTQDYFDDMNQKKGWE